jgi:hypothetical protein
MAKYVRTSKRLQHFWWSTDFGVSAAKQEEMLCCFLPAIQESTSLKELHMELPIRSGPSNLSFESMLTRTQSLRSLRLNFPVVRLEDCAVAVAAARSGLENNTSLQELTVDFSIGARFLPILTSLCKHPLLRRLCLREAERDLSGLETLLLSDSSKITELDIDSSYGRSSNIGLTPVLRALAHHTTLIKLRLSLRPLGHDEARLLQMALCNMPSLQSLDLGSNRLGTPGWRNSHQRCTTTRPSKC